VATDYDAHAWVEAYFPGYGWVRTPDPTPASSDPAQQHIKSLGSSAGDLSGQSGAPNLKPNGTKGLGGVNSGRGGGAAGRHSGASLELLVPGGLVALLVLVMLALLLRHMLIAADATSLLVELERAFTRTGRPLVPQFTLAQLEHRMDGVPEAQAYVHALARARYAGEAALPTPAQRRALRRYLRSGLGVTGALRAYWSLPPLFSQLKQPIKRVTGQ
jgi:hypothetical protein